LLFKKEFEPLPVCNEPKFHPSLRQQLIEKHEDMTKSISEMAKKALGVLRASSVATNNKTSAI
jgi:hypothetical protein